MEDFLGSARLDAILVEIMPKNPTTYLTGLVVHLNEKSIVLATMWEYDKMDDFESNSEERYAKHFTIIDYEEISYISYAI